MFAAASLHWTEPDDRWTRAAAMLEQHGTFASFAGQIRLTAPDVEHAVGAARSRFLVDDGVPSPDDTPADGPMQWPGTELRRCDLFTDVRQSNIVRRAVLWADDYVGHLSTVSAYLQLPGPVRQQVLARISEVLPERVPVIADITLHLARRR